jgi:hypothetical protein
LGPRLFGNFWLNALADCDLGLRLRQRYPRLEPRGSAEVVRLIHRVRIDLKRGPHIRLVDELRWIEVLADHADHDVRLAAQRDSFADDRRVGCETPRPPTI